MNDKILSVSIAAYNTECFLKTCLDSFVIDEIMDELEVLIIDDGSKDNTAKIAKEYVNLYPNTFRLISKENGGHGSTINEGILNAHGKYFKIVDSDDWVDRAGIKMLINYLKDYDADLFFNSYYTVQQATGQKEIKKCVSNVFNKYNCILKFETISPQIRLAMHGMTFKTDILKGMGIKIDEHCFYVDVEYIIYPIPLINNVLVMDFPIYNYLIGSSEQSMNTDNMHKRCEQHLKVCLHLVDYYNQISKKLTTNKKILGKNRILVMLMAQYNIYLTMDETSETCKEISKYDSLLKQKSKDLYKEVIVLGKQKHYKSIFLVDMLRFFNFKFYVPVMSILHRFNFLKSM